MSSQLKITSPINKLEAWLRVSRKNKHNSRQVLDSERTSEGHYGLQMLELTDKESRIPVYVFKIKNGIKNEK